MLAKWRFRIFILQLIGCTTIIRLIFIMFFCSPQPLYYSSFLEEDPSQFLMNEQVTLKEKIKLNKHQIVLPSQFCLSLENPFAIQTVQSSTNLPDYKVKIFQASKIIQINEIRKENTVNLWRVMKQNETDQIFQDDIFGFGNYDFKVYQIGKRNEPQLQERQYETEITCRICFTNQTSDKNPLMSFCECTGSIKYQHLQCLRQWIREGSIKNQFQKWSYVQYSKLICNVCKKTWPQKLKHNKKNYYLYQPEDSQDETNPKDGAKVMLALPTFAQQSDKQSLLIVKFYLTKSQNFIIGADENVCDLILDNLNVSQIQCQLSYQNHKLILKDLNSYNGTGIKMRSMKDKQRQKQKDKNKQGQCFSFSSKRGILLRYNGVLMHIKSKDSIFSCLDAEQTYQISYSHYSS